MADGLVIHAERPESGRGQRPALPAPVSAVKEELDGSPLGGMTRNRSSALLRQLVSDDYSTKPCAEEAKKQSPTVRCVSVGTQTEGMKWDGPMFTVGGGGAEATASSPDPEPCKESHPQADLPAAPRQVEQCVTILKSDVSIFQRTGNL